MEFKLSRKSKERLIGVDPRIIKIINRALRISKIDFGIPIDGGLRTQARQEQLFIQKLSNCDGYKFISSHQTGEAFDVFAYVDGRASWDRHHLTQVAAAILQSASELGHGLQWGGHWENLIDMPHFQLID